MSAAAAKLSIATPVVTLLPGVSAPWEKTASIEDLTQIAETADKLGYYHLTCSEHIALPAAEKRRRGTRYWDPLATLSYLAARTQRIRLATNVLVLGYHHPLEIAKRYGTLDTVSNGRLILGVGVGSSKKNLTSSVRRLKTGAREPTTRCARCAPHCQYPNPDTTASSIRFATWWSTRVPSRSAFPSGWEGAPCVRCGEPPASPKGGFPSE